MLKKLIVLYMVLFASFDIVLDQDIFPSSLNEATISSQAEASIDISVTVISAHDEHNCPDSENCDDCHECHLGHCSVLLGSGVTFSIKELQLSYFRKSDLLITRNIHSVFRPPIEA